jgi:hypothetical protein
MSALPRLGMAWSARFKQGLRQPQFEEDTSLRSEKEALGKRKTLTQFGHPTKSHCRASLRSDNCPNIPEDCPNILE